MKRVRCFVIIFALFAAISAASAKPLVDYANTLQGTNSKGDYSRGNTYPSTAVPYPVHSYSAQTGHNGHGWKYSYADTTIRGFQLVHQCSPWVNDYCVFSLFPETGELVVDEAKRASAFSHDNETGRPNHYQVQFDNGIKTEISPTERCGHFRFTFPEGKDAWVVFDGYTGQSSIEIDVKNQRITGWVHNGAWLVPGKLKGYFILEFDKPFEACGTWQVEGNAVNSGETKIEGDKAGAYIKFAHGSVVQVKTAMSYMSPEQAQVTFDREIASHKSLDDTKAAAGKLWNDLFARVKVEGKSEADKATFYSCLFRANLFSHKFYEIDADGKPYYFSPFDEKTHDGYMYTDNGFWDTFRSQFPLTNILHPTLQGRYMQAILDTQKQCGWLPAWACPGNSGIMIGNHAISLLTDAWAKGIRCFDPEQALEAYHHEITNQSIWGGSVGRKASKEWFELGYIPNELDGEASAKTLEYAYDDFCGYKLAEMTGNEFYMQVFGRQMYNYKNVWDENVSFMRGRSANGSWLPDFSPYRWGGPFTEGNSFQYTWSVFHDIHGLIELMGGEEAFIARLDELFDGSNEYDVGSYGYVIHEISEMIDADMGQYAHGNQPVQHVSYLYNFAGQPWKTQRRVREIMTRLYNGTENGYPGDEDQGGLSSWYVLSALGIYAVCPGTDQYVIGSPMFEKASITLEDGKLFTIEAKGNSPENVYIDSATLNGEPLSRNWITYGEIAAGGILSLQMSDKPNLTRGTAQSDRPFSVSTAPAPVTGIAGKQHRAVTPVEQTWALAVGWWKPRHEDIKKRNAEGNVDMIFVGDSITHGWENEGRELWDEYYAPRNAVNMGFGGDRTEHVLWRLDHGALDNINPKLAVVMIGTNNSNDNEYSAEEIADGIKAICQRIRTKLPETKILLLSIFPRGSAEQMNDKNRQGEYNPQWAKNDKASQIASLIADHRNIFYLDVNKALLNKDGVLTRDVMPDLLHPNKKGYELWIEAMEPTVTKLMGEE